MKFLAPGIGSALAAALLFGAGTPLAKMLLASMGPQMLAGVLYLGSGLGMAALIGMRRLGLRGKRDPLVLPSRREWKWLAGATLFGGVLGPLLLLAGLRVTAASAASLLLNLEGVFTALLAWFVFRENFDRRIALGMALIVAGGLVLAGVQGGTAAPGPGALAIAGACLCWAIDNNLTRKVSAGDAMLIAGVKGLVAGTCNIALALAAGQAPPAAPDAALAGALGFLSYGLSLALFVVALRHLGTARTGAYFSIAPFFGALLAVTLLGEPVSLALLAGGLLMAAGVWLHLTERHEHEHVHEPLGHEHAHVHDDHHRHAHDFAWDGKEPHTHRHQHAPLRHKHPHFPDIHHEHRH
jgi:drug/metabolite transporter (DMT)-like permease